MRIFLAGATGALGKRLAPLLVSDGHRVVGMTKTPAKTSQLQAAGVEPVVADALDRSAVLQAVVNARPEVVIHQVTALAKLRNLRNWEREFALTNRLRTEGTENLLAAAQQAGARLFVAQSYTGWPNERSGGLRKTEDDPLDSSPPPAMRTTLEAILRLERIVTSAAGLTGIVLRYGSFYGPGTSIAEDGDIVEMVRQRKFPIFGDGAGVWSFLHIDDAAGCNQARHRARDSRDLQHRGQRTSTGFRLASRAGPGNRRQAALSSSSMGRQAADRRRRHFDDDQDPRLIEWQGKTRPGMAAGVPKLARRISPRSRRGAAAGG